MSRKNLFDMNLDNESGMIDSEEFITRTLGKETNDKRSALVDEYYKASSKNLRKGISKKSIALIAVIFGVGAILYALNSLFALLESETLKLVWYGIVAIIIIFMRLIKIPSKKRSNLPKPSKKMLELGEELGKLNKLIEKEVGLPEDAKDIDVFLNIYDETEGNLANDKAKLFEEDNDLCLYYDGYVLSIKKESFREIVKIDEDIYLGDWHKDVPYDRGSYMQYKIQKVDEKAPGLYKEYKMHGFYSVRFSQYGGEYEILVPLYDIEPFCNVLRLSPKDFH